LEREKVVESLLTPADLSSVDMVEAQRSGGNLANIYKWSFPVKIWSNAAKSRVT
jgi:hypothetical protein